MRGILVTSFAFLLTGLLVGCGAAPVQHICPLVVPWSVADQLALAADLKASKSLLIHRAVQEDAGYREWARRCQAVR